METRCESNGGRVRNHWGDSLVGDPSPLGRLSWGIETHVGGDGGDSEHIGAKKGFVSVSKFSSKQGSVLLS